MTAVPWQLVRSSNLPNVRIVRASHSRPSLYLEVSLLLLVAVCSCDSLGSRPTPPALSTVDQIRLQESDSLYLGRPYDLHVGDEGHFFVSDAFADHIVEYDRQGTPIQVYGARGAGPGEFESVGIVNNVDSLVIGIDDDDPEFLVFQKGTGEYIRNVEYRGRVRSAFGDSLYGALSSTTNTSLISWNPTSSEVSYYVSLPQLYREFAPLAQIYNIAHPLEWQDTLAVTYTGLDRIFIYDQVGSDVPSRVIPIPSELRRGEPANYEEIFTQQSFNVMYEAMSHLMDAHLLPKGLIALVHSDPSVISAQDRVIRRDTYLSVVDVSRSRACVDAVVSRNTDVRPLTAFRGDTLFVLRQRVQGDVATSSIGMREIEIDSCVWLSVDGKS